MKKKTYTEEFKEQVLKECNEVGNIALVARRHNITPSTIHTWKKSKKNNGSTQPLPKDVESRINELENRLSKVSSENNRLKRISVEKDLKIAILEELKDEANPL